MFRGHVVHVASHRQKASTSHAVSLPFPMERSQTPSFLRYQDLSIDVPLHAKVRRSSVKASTVSTGFDAVFLSSSSPGTPISPGLPLALPGASTYAASLSSLTSLASDPAYTPSILLSSPSVASSIYSTRKATTSDGSTPSTSTILELQRAPPATMPTTTITTSQVMLTMPITTATLPPPVLSTFSPFPSPSSSTDSSTTHARPTTTSAPHHSPPTSSTPPASLSSIEPSTTRFFTITSHPDPTSSVTNVSMTSTDIVTNTRTILGLAPVTSSGSISTVTTIKVITATLQGGRTTVVSSVVESRGLSTSDPVLGSRFSHNTGAIIGVAVSATLGVILSVFAVFFSCTRYRSNREERLYGGQRRRRRRRRNTKEFGSAGPSGWLDGVCGRKRLSPIPAGPIFTQPPRSRRSHAGLDAGGAPDRVNSSTRILGIHTPDDLEDEVGDDEVSWRPPLAEEDDEELGRAQHVPGASVMGRIGYGYGQGFVHPYVDRHGAVEGGGGVSLPTPPESGEGQRKSSLGHSQSWGHSAGSSGHGHGHTQAQPQPQASMENALLRPGSGIPLPLADSLGTSSIPAVAQYVAYGYPGVAGGVGVRNLGNAGNVGVGFPPAVCSGPHTAAGAWMRTGWEGRPHDGPQVTDEEKPGDGPPVAWRRASVIGVEGLVTPRTSECGDFALSGSPTVNNASVYDTSGSGPVPERRSVSGASRRTADATWATTRVASSSTSSRSKSIKDVLGLGRFRTLSATTRRNSNGATVLVRPMSALVNSAGAGGGTNGGGVVMTRPGYDYGAIMRPHTRERSTGHYQLHRTLMQDGQELEPKPPSPVLLADHERSAQYSSVRDEANEEASLDTRRSIVRDALLDPNFLSPAGSSPNIDGASLRDYVDYSRRIGGMVKSISMSTFDTANRDMVST